MSTSSDDRPGDRPARHRRRRVLVGVVGLTAMLGTGTYLVTAQIADRTDDIPRQDTNAIAPIAPRTSVETSSAASAAGATPSMTPTPTATTKAAVERTNSAAPMRPEPSSVRKQIDAARAAAARDGFPLRRPLTPAPGVARNSSAVSVKNTTLPDGGTRRIITSKGDLSGQREMLWAADDGKPVDNCRCTQNFHFSANGKAAVRPTMSLCWRISATRSVVVLSIAKQGRPSLTDSAAVIDRQWDKLG